MDQSPKNEMLRAKSENKTASDSQDHRSREKILLALAGRIRSERKQKGFAQEDFSAERGFHRTEMELLLRGKTIPRLDTSLLVAQHLRLPASELLRGIEL